MGKVCDILIVTLVMVDIFFREIRSRGSFRIPRRGPVIFVAAPHANQFVDPLILMREARKEAGRRISFLIAAKSMRERIVGFLAKLINAIPVARAQDEAVRGKGTIKLAGRSTPLKIIGTDSQFLQQNAAPGLTILLPNDAGTAEIQSVESDVELTLKKEFRSLQALELLDKAEGTGYRLAPKIDQTHVYAAVFGELENGGCIGIYPEGGSHDRPDLLPLKAGVAVMALGTLAQNPGCDLKIVPCGMNYFHPHKFRSRAVIEFGQPLTVPPELVEKYKAGDKRDAVKALLDLIYNSLLSVTVTTIDYETLMVIQAARRLYKPAHRRLPLPQVVELNRRFITGYEHFRDHPEVVSLRSDIMAYNKQLRQLNIRDHQVKYMKYGICYVLTLLVYRSAKLIALALAALPGAILFSPIFTAGKVISTRKAKAALKASTVKIRGRDVLATWKFLVALGLAPLLYTLYAIILSIYCYSHDLLEWQSWKYYILLVPLLQLVVLPSISFAALRFGESGMDIYKSLRPLFLAINPSSVNTITKLRLTRERLAAKITDLINTLGPEVFPDFDATRVVAMPEASSSSSLSSVRHHHRRTSSGSSPSTSGGHNTPGGTDLEGLTPSASTTNLLDLANLTKTTSASTLSNQPLLSPTTSNTSNISYGNIGFVPIFQSTPRAQSPERKTSAVAAVDEDANFETLNQSIRGSNVERRKRREMMRSGNRSDKKADFEDDQVEAATTGRAEPLSNGTVKERG